MNSERRISLGVLVGLLLIALAVPLATYGTLSPCGMLKQEAMTRLAERTQESLEEHDYSAGAQAGVALGGMMAERRIDAELASASPAACAKRVWKLNTDCEGIMSLTAPCKAPLSGL